MTTALTDTHAHLNSEALEPDWRTWMDRAEKAGVHTVFVPGWDLPSSRSAVRLADTDTRIRAIVGIHPASSSQWNSDTMRELSEMASHPGVVAIGEIGLDTYRGEDNLDQQEHACREQMELARRCGLPVVLHCRPGAGTPGIVDTLLGWLVAHECADGAIWHCYGGDWEQAGRIADSGGFFGFDGPLTYKKNDALRRIAASVPRDRLLLETDAPWLSPEPWRGRHPNVPEHLTAVAAALASATGLELGAIARLTDDNTRRAFPRWNPGNPPAAVAI